MWKAKTNGQTWSSFINARGSVTMILKAAGIDVTELDGGSSLSIKQAKTFKRYLGRI